MKTKIMMLSLLSVLMTGCQSTNRPDSSYVYVPRELSSQVHEYLSSEALTSNNSRNFTAEYFPEQSYVELTYIAEPDFSYMHGSNEVGVYKDLCLSESGFYSWLRESGVGLKVTLRDDRSFSNIGPWNIDACKKHSASDTSITN